MYSQWQRQDVQINRDPHVIVDDWNEWKPSEQEIAYAHFQERQQKKYFQTVLAPMKVRFSRQWCSCLMDISDSQRPKLVEDPAASFLGRSIPKKAVVINKVFGSSPDTKSIDLIQRRLLIKIRTGMHSANWMREAVLYPLSAEQLQRVQDYSFHLPRGYTWRFLVNNSVAFLLVSTQQSKENTISVIEKVLRTKSLEPDVITLSEPSSAVEMDLQYGKDPTFVMETSESRFALVFDEMADGKETSTPQKFYEMKLNCHLLHNRLITDPEKRWMEVKLQRYDLRSRPIRLLEFRSSEEKNKAMETGGVEFLDLLYCDSMFNYQEHHDTVHLYIDHDMAKKSIYGVAVTVRHETQKEILENVFKEHRLSVHYFNGDKKDMDMRYKTSTKTMVLQDFPHHLNHYEARARLVNKIIELNNIAVDKVEFHTEKIVPKPFAKKESLLKKIEYDLYRIGHEHNIYRPIDQPWIESLNGDLGARHFLELVKERGDVPWKVSRKVETSKKGSAAHQERFTVHFKNIPTALTFIEKILLESFEGSVFGMDGRDRTGTKLTPCFRQSFAISRTLRSACNHQLHTLDKSIREVFPILSRNNDPLMEEPEAQYYAVRLFDEWKEGNDCGIIGVMGWNPNAVRHFSMKLKEVFAPKIFDAKEECPSLLFGIGELYVMSLAEKYGTLVVEVDKFNEHIKLIGDQTDAALSDLQNYSKERKNIEIAAEIPAHFPFLNPSIKEFMFPEVLEDLRKACGIRYLVFDLKRAIFQFEGHIEAYEELMKFLEKISAEIFKKETMNFRGQVPNETCLTCWTEISSSTDFYRFRCGHVMCRQCTNAKIRNISFVDTKIVCSQEGCEKFVAPSDIKRIILGGPNRIHDLDTEKLAQLNREVKSAVFSLTRDVINCTTTDCNGILWKSDGPLDEYKNCGACDRQYCRKCLADPHTGTSCEEYDNLRQPDYSMAAYMRENGEDSVKKCPHCQMYAEKISGCNHVQCAKCSTHFCWVCLYFELGKGCQVIYAHMTDVHGGNGLENMNPADFEDADLELQRAIENGFWVDSDTDDDEEDENVNDDRRNREHYGDAFVDNFLRDGVAGGARGRLRRRRRMNRNMIVPLVAHPQPRARSPPRPRTPPRPRPFEELPEVLRDIVPRDQEEMYINFINTANTVEQQLLFIQEAIENLRPDVE
uniref:RING-type domain-containing protein n=1 Tax=Caenorhabditis tropicalis TaxID=1561998 RepID=A0A1I7TFN8_9PELO